MSKTIQVFEHDSLHVGKEYNGVLFQQEHLDALALFSERNQQKYYRLMHRAVKFLHYVGALQVGALTIEILPKADNTKNPDTRVWQKVLLDMLQACSLIKIESLSSANLRLKPNAILELYFLLFIEEVERLLEKGLVRTYFSQDGQLKHVKGRILFEEQIKRNLIHQERIYAAYAKYDYNHKLNLILWQALSTLKQLAIPLHLESRIRTIQDRFPPLKFQQVLLSEFDRISYDRKTIRYKTAIEIAQLIIGNFSPDIRTGQYHLMAILFDMNLLFEEYVYRLLLKECGESRQIWRQARKPFWARRKIQPDIVLRQANKNYVMDTKWKVLTEAQPAINDLKQMFVYSQYFDAEQSVLLYPAVHEIEEVPSIPYAPNASGRVAYCRTLFLQIIKVGRLNKQLGKEILESITAVPSSEDYS